MSTVNNNVSNNNTSRGGNSSGWQTTKSSSLMSSSQPTFWVCGEVLIDRLPKSSTSTTSTTGEEEQGNNDEDDDSSSGYVNVVGGGAANTAKCLARLGCGAVEFIDGISNDPFGKLAEENLLDSRVSLRLCKEFNDKPTCLATVSFDDEKKASYEFRIENTATFDFDRSWLPLFMRPATNRRPNVVHVGTLATVIEPGASEIYNWLVDGCFPNGGTGRNIPIVYDPNIRPTVLGDRDRYRESVEKFVAISTVIKASDDDLRWLYPDRSYEDVAKSWLLLSNDNNKSKNKIKSKLVVVTLGGDGMIGYYYCNNHSTSWVGDRDDGDVTHSSSKTKLRSVTSVPKKEIRLVDTVGAGDTVGAVLTEAVGVYGISALTVNANDNVLLQSVLDNANTASGITCSRKGCQPPSHHELLMASRSLSSSENQQQQY